MSRGSGAALRADSTSKFSRAVSRRTKTQEMALIAGWRKSTCTVSTPAIQLSYGGQRSLWLLTSGSADVLMGGYWSKKEEAGEEKGQKKKRHGGGRGRRVVGRGVRLEQREGAVMVRGVSSLDGLLVLKRTR